VAKDFLDDAINRNGSPPHIVHADRGGAMVSKPVSELLVDLGVLRSHSHESGSATGCRNPPRGCGRGYVCRMPRLRETGDPLARLIGRHQEVSPW
jgi:hypothetical protein